MRDMNLKAIWIKKYRPEKHEKMEEKLKNVLSRDFSPPEANMAWVTDITYIYTEKGFVYLSSIMDLYSRKIIS